MERLEAIEWLKAIKEKYIHGGDDFYDYQRRTAIDYATAFLSKEDAVEVVRCKDCKYWIHVEDGFGDCTNGRFHLDGHADPTMKMDDFCSCGERKDND